MSLQLGLPLPGQLCKPKIHTRPLKSIKSVYSDIQKRVRETHQEVISEIKPSCIMLCFTIKRDFN